MANPRGNSKNLRPAWRRGQSGNPGGNPGGKPVASPNPGYRATSCARWRTTSRSMARQQSRGCGSNPRQILDDNDITDVTAEEIVCLIATGKGSARDIADIAFTVVSRRLHPEVIY